jgi:hypothetical protein
MRRRSHCMGCVFSVDRTSDIRRVRVPERRSVIMVYQRENLIWRIFATHDVMSK